MKASNSLTTGIGRCLTLIALFSVACVASLIIVRGGSAAQTQDERFRRSGKAIPHQYVVVLTNDTPGKQVASVKDDLVAKYSGTARHSYTTAIKGFSIEMDEAQAIALSKDPQVAYVEEDSVLTLYKTQHSAPWGIDRIDQRDLPLNLNYSFSNVNTGAGVHAYVIDSGIMTSHPEFRTPSGQTRAVSDRDFVGDGQNGNDCIGHGTFVAGVIGGNRSGVAKGVTLHSLRVAGCSADFSMSNAIAAIDWLTGNHLNPAVVNMSFGGDPDNWLNHGIDYGLEDAIRGSMALGITYVAAAGNHHRLADISPARMPEIITVGASNSSDQRWSDSNFGPQLDLFAPGENINSASIHDNDNNGVLDDFTFSSGTSFAAPHVTGVVARMLQAEPFLTPAAVQGAIKNSASPRISDQGPGSPNLLLYSNIHVEKTREANVPSIPEALSAINSDLVVSPNEWVSFSAGGSIWAGVWLTGNNPPEGWNSIENNSSFPLPGARPFSLIGNFNLGENFYVGRSNATMAGTISQPSNLFLGINDNVPGNGNGAFNCQVQVWRKLADAEADFVSQSVPTTMIEGQTTSVSITMKNTGTSTWNAANGYAIGPEPEGVLFGAGHRPVTGDVPPGASATFTFNITHLPPGLTTSSGGCNRKDVRDLAT